MCRVRNPDGSHPRRWSAHGHRAESAGVTGAELPNAIGTTRFRSAAGNWLVGWDAACPNLILVYDLTAESSDCLVITGYTDLRYSIYPYGVSSSGVVVGRITDQLTDERTAFAIDYPTDPSTPLILSRRPGWDSHASGITENGHIVGFMRSGSAAHWVIWDLAGDTVSVSGRAVLGVEGFSQPADASLPMLVGRDGSSGSVVAYWWNGTAGDPAGTLSGGSYEETHALHVGPDGTIYGRGDSGSSREVIAWSDPSSEPVMVADFHEVLTVVDVDENGLMLVRAGVGSDGVLYCLDPDRSDVVTELAPSAGRTHAEADVIFGDRVFGNSRYLVTPYRDVATVWDLSAATDGCKG